MPPPILILRNIQLTFGGTPLLEGASFSLSSGDRLCLVGRNGSGKSTLLKIAAGSVTPDDGEVFLQPGSTIRYLPQEPDLSGYAKVLDYVEDGLDPGVDHYRGAYLLEQLKVDAKAEPGTLSGGEARRAALARTLAPQPDILLLDEPTNHLDLPAIEWLESELSANRAAQILISHDRRFLENLSRVTLWLDRGQTKRLDAGFARFEEWRDQMLETEETELHKLDRRIASETQWLRKGVTARRKRNQGRLRALYDLRDKRQKHRRVEGNIAMAASDAAASGKRVIEAKNISKAFGDLSVIQDFSIRIQRGDRVGFVGPNGAGKTTLVNMLTGNLKSDTGDVKEGANVEMLTIDQRRESLDPGTTLRDALTGGGGDTVMVGGQARHVVGYMKDFLFAPEQLRTPIERLSGGERGRLMLARALAKPSNLLILDEPTNDLDLETLDLLQELLADYAGTLLLVSHDRDFLDRVVTSTVAYEGVNHWTEYAGGYSDMLVQRGGDLVKAETAPSPSKVFKPEEKPAVPRTLRKLSYKQNRALKTLPSRMEDLQNNISDLEKILSQPELYACDPKKFKATTMELTARQSELASAEEEWLELEVLREEIEGAL
ncbi:MAG: ABC-F family ATP-binding cassette domain-containing protein [Candidatus Latescibacterota bacterium]